MVWMIYDNDYYYMYLNVQQIVEELVAMNFSHLHALVNVVDDY